MTPPVTVLLSVYNGGPYLAESIRSILEQTFTDFEFLIIDDASTDATPEILRSLRDPRIKVVRNESNLGLTASLNRGLSLAQGDFIARHDADDFSHPRRIAAQLNYLQANPSVAAVGAQARLIDARGAGLGRKDFPLCYRSLWWAHLFDNSLAHAAVTFRKKVVLEAGGYDPWFVGCEDYELWSRLGERHAIVNLPERLITLRILETSIIRTHKRPELNREIQARHFERLFPGRAATEAELDLLGQFRSRLPPVMLPAFHALIDDLIARYQAAWPETRASADFSRTIALIYERTGYNLLPIARGLGWSLMARAIRISPARLGALPWLRMAALTFFGDRARVLYERLGGKSASS